MVKKIGKKTIINFKVIFSTFLRARKKTLLINCLFGLMFILILNSSLIIWYTYRAEFYNSYISSIDWYNDSKISGLSQKILEFDSNITQDYFNSINENISNSIESIAPGLINKFTSLQTVLMSGYPTADPLSELNTYAIHLISPNNNQILSNSLSEGEMPRNYTELLYYPISESNEFSIYDSLTLKPEMYLSSMTNFTISGIISNLKFSITQFGLSQDIDVEKYKTILSQFSFGYSTIHAHFFTTVDNFVNIINHYPNFSSFFYLLIDISYNTSAIPFGIKDSIQESFYTLSTSGLKPDANSEITFKVGNDLYAALNHYQSVWIVETVKVLIFSFSMFFLLAILLLELLFYNLTEFESIIRLLTLEGIDFRTVKRVIFLESLLSSSIGWFLGTTLSFIVGFVFNVILSSSSGSSLTLNYFNEPLFSALSIFALLGLLFGTYFKKKSDAKNIILSVTKSYSKRRRHNIGIFRSFTVISLIVGIILPSLALPSIFLISYYLLWASSNSQGLQVMLITFVLLLFIGLLLLFSAILMMLTKTVSKLLKKLGGYLWQRKKSPFTLAIKKTAFFAKNYHQLSFGILLIGLGIIPGLVLAPLISNHDIETTNLSLGCSDIVVNGWTGNQTLRGVLEEITSIEATTEILLLDFLTKPVTNFFNKEYCNIRMLVINELEFITVSHLDRLSSKISYDQNDILSLNSNYTYMIDTKTARKFDLDKTILSPSNIFSEDTSEAMFLVGDFNVFPSLQQFEENWLKTYFYGENELAAQNLRIVIGHSTYQNLFDNIYSSDLISSNSQLLIKTKSESNIAQVKAELVEKYDLNVDTFEDLLAITKQSRSTFILIIFRVYSLLGLLGLFVHIILNGLNLYEQQVRVIEATYRVGISRTEILRGFMLELSVNTIFPTLFAVFASSFFVYCYALILSVNQQYNRFSFWLPVWILLLALFISISLLNLGWFIGIKKKISQYQPVKQE
ncbi:MAG: hypothetical protein JXA54_11485 [Candidatus Heimdallarchaeota archaeon]|nr:hypothetical protein [Candidatus Heimdallarchaeota archaeon]